MSEARILIVEDEPDVAELIRFHIERDGLEAKVIRSGRLALDEIKQCAPRLVVLDLMLPDLDGMEICRKMRWNDATRSTPIIIVSAKGEESDIVAGLELGADDYVTKPFSPRVLMARIRNLLRRVDRAAEAANEPAKRYELLSGHITIDIDRRAVTVKGQSVELTRTEFDILECLVARPGFVRTRDQIIASVHGENAVLTSRTVDVHMTAIRRKLGDFGRVIRTVRGVGYRLDESAIEAETS